MVLLEDLPGCGAGAGEGWPGGGTGAKPDNGAEGAAIVLLFAGRASFFFFFLPPQPFDPNENSPKKVKTNWMYTRKSNS